jgi:hypothetical protein
VEGGVPLRSHPAVIASIVAAALAVAACAVVAIGYMLGWVGHAAPPTPAAIATPGQQLAGTAPDMGLLPGETVVTMPEPPKSAIPSPPKPTIPAPTGPCVNCGIVASIVVRGRYWDVDVRYDDGSAQTLRYPERPRLRSGERVHFEDGRLLPGAGR